VYCTGVGQVNPLTSLMMINWKIEMKSTTAIQWWNGKY